MIVLRAASKILLDDLIVLERSRCAKWKVPKAKEVRAIMYCDLFCCQVRRERR